MVELTLRQLLLSDAYLFLVSAGLISLYMRLYFGSWAMALLAPLQIVLSVRSTVLHLTIARPGSRGHAVLWLLVVHRQRLPHLLSPYPRLHQHLLLRSPPLVLPTSICTSNSAHLYLYLLPYLLPCLRPLTFAPALVPALLALFLAGAARRLHPDRAAARGEG